MVIEQGRVRGHLATDAPPRPSAPHLQHFTRDKPDTTCECYEPVTPDSFGTQARPRRLNKQIKTRSMDSVNKESK
ncbi:hypothetical protein E2C01_064088 [Portunus trituberculatus]|uniref:Uncharacterized protein n=1 Tax=Portunus trituberculatus TaxID=210409 RepID=A0A5B7HIT6_PORTR|nr:hypothetical protein [Portunus trituberculatus]